MTRRFSPIVLVLVTLFLGVAVSSYLTSSRAIEAEQPDEKAELVELLLDLARKARQAAEQPSEKPTSVEWEYTVVQFWRVQRASGGTDLVAVEGSLNRLGAAGWEVCGVCWDNQDFCMYYTLKRPRRTVSRDTSSKPPAVYDTKPAKEHQIARAADLGIPLEVTNSIGMKLVFIPLGDFQMGSPDSDSNTNDNEKPQHTVRITKPFYLGMTEVTQEQYEQVIGTNPSNFKGAQLPVEKVSWQDAVEFCRKLSELPAERSAGRVYRLPTEAEWEYACRAGSQTKWSFGDAESSLGNYAWYAGNSDKKTNPVGQKKPNAWGLYDMHGNVRESCSDWYETYASATVSDPMGPATGSTRVNRGGGWYDDARRCRSAYRDWRTPDSRGIDLGFRLAFSSVDQSGQ